MWLMQVKIKCIGFSGNQLWNFAGYLDVADSSGLGFMIYRASRNEKLQAGRKPLQVCNQIRDWITVTYSFIHVNYFDNHVR